MKQRRTNQSNYKNTAQNKRRTAAKKKSGFVRFLVTFSAIVIAVCIILIANRNVTNADESGNAVVLTKYYKTITIEEGDTLWSLAQTYKSGDYETTQDYVDELKSMNGLHSDQITSGQKLVVACFSE